MGSSAGGTGGLRRARDEAVELSTLPQDPAAPPVVAFEDRWCEVTLARAAAAVRPRDAAAPLPAGLDALRRHDDERGTDYLRTLAAHLDHHADPAGAAAALHVHPNTLRYRLARMAEVADLGLDDPVTRLALRLHLLGLP